MAIFIPTGSMADAKWLTQIRRPSPRKGISTIGPLWKIYQRGAIGSWTDTSHALNECAALIIGARGRLRVYFFISPTSKEDISGVAELQDLYLFRSRGDTPTYQRLKRQLDEFVEAFASRNGSQREAYPGLNLVIFTDEAPEELLEDIEEVIGDMAKELDSLEAEKYKVGIQFVQIENDGSVTNFFERIDNVIKGEYGLRRDVSKPLSLQL